MANTMVFIASVTVGSGGASTIDFTSIPQTYTDLCLKISAKSASSTSVGTDGIKLEINTATTGFTNKQLYGSGNTAGAGGGSSNYTGANLNNASGTTNIHNNTEFYFSNYAGSTYKSFLVDSIYSNNSTTAYELDLSGNLWSNTAAITQLTLKTLQGTNFVQYSTAYLYGIKKS